MNRQKPIKYTNESEVDDILKVTVKFFEKLFTGETSKDAYLNACKWVAKHVVSKVEIGETFWKTEKIEADLPTFKLELHAMLDAEESTKGFCDKCQEFHRSFYINQQFNCDKCNYTAFKKQVGQKLIIKKDWRLERLNAILNSDD